MSHDIVVWGAGTGRAMRVHWMLHEVGLEYHCQPVGPRTGETQTPGYLSMNPKGKIPVLEHQGFVLSESVAIIRYISRNFELPDGFFAPLDSHEEAVLDEWCVFIAMELDAHPLYTMRRHGDLKQIYGAAPEVVESAQEYFLKQLNAVVPSRLEKQTYLMGEKFSEADILLTTCLDWAHAYGIPLSTSIMDYRAQALQRTAYRSADRICFPGRSDPDTNQGDSQ